MDPGPLSDAERISEADSAGFGGGVLLLGSIGSQPTIIFASRAVAERLGCSPVDLEGREPDDLEIASLGLSLAAAIRTEALALGSEVELSRGAHRTCRVRIEAGSGLPNRLVLTMLDVPADALVKRIAAQLPASITLYDRERRLRYANEAARRQYPTDYSRILGRPIEEYVPEARARRELHERALRGEPVRVLGAPATAPGANEPQYFDMEYRGLRGESGQIDHFLVMATDVTARTRAEMKVRESELRHRTIADLVPGFIFEGALGNGTCHTTWVSEGFERFRGCRLEVFGDHGPDRLFGPETVAQLISQAPGLIQGEDVVTEVSMRCADGAQNWLRLVARAVPSGPDSGLDRVLGIGEDVTERKRLDKALEEVTLREQLRLGQEIHDGLGQELTGLAYFASSLARDAARQASPQATDLAALADLAQRAVKSCRDIARGVSPLTESRGLLVASLRQMVARAAVSESVSLSFEARERASVTLGWDARNHLHRIAQEALHNALRHANARQIDVTIDVDADLVRVAVADDGDGFDPGSGSAGVGLDSMRQRAAAIGARFAVGSRQPRGTVVTCECAQPGANGPETG